LNTDCSRQEGGVINNNETQPKKPDTQMKTNTPAKSSFNAAFTLLFIFTSVLIAASEARAANGTWINLVNGDASGPWSAAANWSGGTIADGADSAADFSTLDLTTNSIVTLDTTRTIGNLIFGDTAPGNNWLLTGSTLTLQTSSGTPTITANNGSNTVSAVLAGTTGLAKAGVGTLDLSAANNTTLSGNINVNAGILAVGNNNALGATTANGSATLSNAVMIADGATVQVLGGIGPNLHTAYAGGSGVGGTQGVIYSDLSGLAQGNTSTRWSISLLTAASPGMIMLGDTTIRVDGTNNSPLASVMLIGHITTSNALTATPVNFTNYTLTKIGTGQLRVDPANGYTGGNIHVAQGSLAFGNNGDLPSFQTVTLDPGTQLYCRNVTSLNSANSTLVVNGLMDLDARGTGAGGSDTTTATQTIGYLAGDGIVTNGTAGNAGVNTLVIGGTSGSATVFSGTIPQCGNGSIGLRIQCAGSTQKLAGNNSYTGTTVINSGTLLVNGINSGTGAYSVNSLGTLGGTGAIPTAPISLNGGTIMAGDPSNPGGTFAVSNITAAAQGSVIVSNATLAVNGSIGSSSLPVGTVYMTNGTLQVSLGTLGASVFATGFNVDGNATISFKMATPIKGQFPIISYSSIGGLAGFGGLSLVAPAGVGATLSNNVNNSTIDVVISSVPVLTWTGVPNGNWDIGTTTNWSDGAGGEPYTEPSGAGLIVNFDDTAPGTTGVNITTTVTPKGVLVNSSTLNYTFSGSGHISGTGALTKQGNSTLAIANSGNDFSGGVNLQQGTLQLGNGSTTGDLGSGPLANSGNLVLDRSDSFILANIVSGNGNLTQAGAGAVTVPVSGDSTGTVSVNSGTLQIGPSGTNQFFGNVTGAGAFGVNGSGTLVLNGAATYAGGTVISNGTLQFNSSLPPSGNIIDNGTLAFGIGGSLPNSISGSGGISVLNAADLTLGTGKTYTGPTTVLNSSLEASGSTYPAASTLVLGNQNGGEIGVANFSTGNPVLGGLNVGGNLNALAANQINLTAGGQTLSINGNVSFGNSSISRALVSFAASGTGASIIVNTNGGVIQSGLYTSPNGGNPDSLFVDLSLIDNFVANLGTNGSVNLGTLDGNPGPTTSVNQFTLAAVSNAITAGTIVIGAGGRQLVPELMLGSGTNLLNVNAVNIGTGGRDGGYLHFATGTGGLAVRANDGVSRAAMNVGVNTTTGTGAGVTNTVDLTGHPADLLLNALVIGNYPARVGANINTFSFDQGILDTLSTRIAAGSLASHLDDLSTMNINGGTASLGTVSLTAGAGSGILNINNATVTVASIASPGTGAAELDLNNSTFNVALAGFGNPASAPVAVKTFNPNGPVNLGLSGTGFTVGQFPLLSYVGNIGGAGFPALTLTSLPSGVSGYLSNNVLNLSIDMVITNAPPAINPNPTNIVISVSGNQLTLGWPSSHLGWLLQTNSVSLLKTDAWVSVPGSGNTNQFILTIDPAQTNVFFRMLKP
jgi:autotransporter-associated beta strand protein